MIFTTDAAGKLSYLSERWTEVTGQTLADAVDYGWIDVVWPDDREIVRHLVGDAIAEGRAFSVTYRLLDMDGRAKWVCAGAVPSCAPRDRSFLGFLGTVSEVSAGPAPGKRASGFVGRFIPPPESAARRARPGHEVAAGHILRARGLTTQGGSPAADRALDLAVWEISRQLIRTRSHRSIRPNH
jgi:PAS domain S-box-containing protein